MRRQTATSAKQLSVSDAKVALARLMKEGKVRASGARLIDIRKLTSLERRLGEALAQAKHTRAIFGS
ncbi:hypothetical protein [Chthoniobacter flavus]|nr:hypothetical protein [Chthoniobacter flavus]